MKSFEKMINRSMEFFNEPHEKFISNVVLMLIFWVIYYVIYISDTNAMIINKDVIVNKKTNKLDIFDFAWFSTLTQFGITFGDITPKSKLCKVCVISHAIASWYMVLS